jgi:hypothetical protein
MTVKQVKEKEKEEESTRKRERELITWWYGYDLCV